MKSFAVLYLVILLISCSGNAGEKQEANERDRIMSHYFSTIDSMPFQDTASEDFRLLKAYYKNDTVYLNKRYKQALDLLRQVG